MCAQMVPFEINQAMTHPGRVWWHGDHAGHAHWRVQDGHVSLLIRHERVSAGGVERHLRHHKACKLGNTIQGGSLALGLFFSWALVLVVFGNEDVFFLGVVVWKKGA